LLDSALPIGSKVEEGQRRCDHEASASRSSMTRYGVAHLERHEPLVCDIESLEVIAAGTLDVSRMLDFIPPPP
jgi:hypothetical protein